jgi:hypothetical protein
LLKLFGSGISVAPTPRVVTSSTLLFPTVWQQKQKFGMVAVGSDFQRLLGLAQRPADMTVAVCSDTLCKGRIRNCRKWQKYYFFFLFLLLRFFLLGTLVLLRVRFSSTIFTRLSSCSLTNYPVCHDDVWKSGCIDPHLLDLGTSWRWVVSFTPRLLYTWERAPTYPLDRRLGRSQSRCGRHGNVKILAPTGTRTPNPRSSSPYPVAIPTALSRISLLLFYKHFILMQY